MMEVGVLHGLGWFRGSYTEKGKTAQRSSVYNKRDSNSNAYGRKAKIRGKKKPRLNSTIPAPRTTALHRAHNSP